MEIVYLVSWKIIFKFNIHVQVQGTSIASANERKMGKHVKRGLKKLTVDTTPDFWGDIT